MVGQRAPLETRFWSKVLKGARKDCWPWTGTKNNKGYGLIGRGAARLGKALAHRVSYEIHHGPIPEGPTPQTHIVMHTCDNPACVNPAHLKLGTMKANYDDMARKGRRRIVCNPTNRPPVMRGDAHPLRRNPELVLRGENNGFAKLTDADVRDLYARRLAGADFSALARHFDLDPSTTMEICRGTRWAHMPGTPGCPTLAELLAVPVGRSAKRLDAATVLSIRADAAAGASTRTLAPRYGVSLSVVDDIKARRSWKHLS